MNVTQVCEYSTPRIRNGVIEGVKIIGTVSKRGWRYPVEVLRKGKHLYENAPVFILHPNEHEKLRGARRLVDHFGSLQNIRERGDHETFGIFGDLHVKQSHPLAQRVLEEVGKRKRVQPGAHARFGLSHNANIEITQDEKTVTQIMEINSVDVVDNPATTRNLFEDTDMPENNNEPVTPAETGDGNANVDMSFEETMLAFMAKILAYVEPKGADDVKAAEAAGAAAGITEGIPHLGTRLMALENRPEQNGGVNRKPIQTSSDMLDSLKGLR